MFKKRHLSVENKLKIITRVNRGEKMGNLAEEFGIGRTTIHDIYKNRAKIQEYSEAKLYRIGNRQNLRRGKNPRMEEALYEWYLQEKKTGTPINSTIIIARAKEIHHEIFNTDEGFPASVGWLTGFKRRYKVKFTQEDDILQMEDDLDENPEMEEFKNSFFRKVVDLTLCPSQVYVASENELCWRIVPDDNRKFKKDKINFLACANASGLHKLKPLVVNTHTPSELENVDLPVHYFEQKITRVTEQSFKTWFDECFILETRNWLTKHNLPPKALLVVDQSLWNLEEFDTGNENVSVLFYPSECKNMMPLDENTMKTVKQNYKRHLLLTATSRDLPMEEFLGKFNMKDMVFTLAQEVQSLSAFMISVSWKALWDSMILDMDGSIVVEVNTDEQHDPTLLRNVADNVLFPIDVLRKWFDGKYDHADNNVEFSNPKEDNCSTTTQVCLKDAVNSFDICIQWAEQNGSTSEEIGLLRKMRDNALISKHTYKEVEFVDDTQIFGS